MKKAVFTTGGKQYFVSEGETISVELLHADATTVSFNALLVLDGNTVTIGTPTVDTVKVNADVIAEDVQADKVTSIRYKAKKRVHTVRGHRQHQTSLKITTIV